MSAVLALLVFDAKAHWKYLASTFAVMALLPFAVKLGLGHAHPLVILAVSFGIVISLPFTFIGQERLKGTIGFTVSLPFSRTQIVLFKTGECILWSVALVLVSITPSLVLNGVNGPAAAMLLVAEPAVIVVSSCLFSAAYFLFSAQAVTRGFALLLFAITAVTARIPWHQAKTPLSAADAALLFDGCALFAAGAALYAAIRIWGARPSPRA